MKIVGMRIEKYTDKEVSGHNCDFEYTDAEFEKHILFGVNSDNTKVKIELYKTEGECGSGWTTASWGNIDVEIVDNFNGYTFTPKKLLIIDDMYPSSEYYDIENEIFTCSYDGGDSYYPRGSYDVNMNLFIETVRHKNERPIWIFKGDSNSGKTYLSSRIMSLDIYETDSNNTLPEFIFQDIIVLGNKYNFSIEDIEKKIVGEYELIIVDFNIQIK